LTALHRLNALLRRGLAATEHDWPLIRKAFDAVWNTADILANHDERPAHEVQARFDRLMTQLNRTTQHYGTLAPAIVHFVKCAKSYRSGLFHCYDLPDLPRTNNGLEQYFGSARYHERRISGHKVASPTTIVRGPARLLAAVATRICPPSPDQLRPSSMSAWQALRQSIEFRHEARRKQRRFRRDPNTYLHDLELRLVKLILPT
jgi:hypothetical protein